QSVNPAVDTLLLLRNHAGARSEAGRPVHRRLRRGVLPRAGTGAGDERNPTSDERPLDVTTNGTPRTWTPRPGRPRSEDAAGFLGRHHRARQDHRPSARAAPIAAIARG